MDFEKRESGLLVPAEKGFVHGRYMATLIHRGEIIDEFEFDNICVNEGMTSMLNSTFAGQSANSNWYIGVFSNNYTPVLTDTASTIVNSAGEFTGYSGGARPTFQPATATGPTLTNAANRASFTFTGAATLLGAFLITSPTPGSNTGTLFSAAQFGAAKTVGNTDQLLLTYTLSASSS